MKRKFNVEGLPSVLTKKSSNSRRKFEVIENEPSIRHKSDISDEAEPQESPIDPIENSDAESDSDDSNDVSKDSDESSEDFDLDSDEEDVSNPGSDEGSSDDIESNSKGEAEIFSRPSKVTQYESAEGLTTLRLGQKPKIDVGIISQSSGLLEKLKKFLPEMAAANDALDAERSAGTLSERVIEMSDDDNQERYIEMNLGLGILEEKPQGDAIHKARASAEDSSTDSSSSGEEDVLSESHHAPKAHDKSKRIMVQEVKDAHDF